MRRDCLDRMCGELTCGWCTSPEERDEILSRKVEQFLFPVTDPAVPVTDLDADTDTAEYDEGHE